MLKMAIISSSSVVDAGRWDAGFHLLQKTHEARIAQLKKAMTKSQAEETVLEMFEAVPAKHRKALSPLLRGRDLRAATTLALQNAAKEYPYIAIATFEAERDAIKATIDEQIAEAEASKVKLQDSLATIDQIIKKA